MSRFASKTKSFNIILFLRSHACTAKVFIVVKYVHHGRWPSRTSNPRNQLPSPMRRALGQTNFVYKTWVSKCRSRTNSLSFDLGLSGIEHRAAQFLPSRRTSSTSATSPNLFYKIRDARYDTRYIGKNQNFSIQDAKSKIGHAAAAA